MSAFIRRFATPFIIAFFTISAISGVVLFFHLARGAVEEMHEWLSMVLLLAVALHLTRNWRSFAGYFTNWPIALAAVVAVVLAVPFVAGGGEGERGNAGFRLMAMVGSAPLTAVAPVLKTTPDALAANLRAKGYQVSSTGQSLMDIARASGKEPGAVFGAALPPGGAPRPD